MTEIKRSSLVAYSAADMFRIVDDIDAYAEFLPWCQASKVLERHADWVEAQLEISKAGFSGQFTTRNQINEDAGTIVMNLVEGPFKRLRGEWLFEPMDDQASRVSLHLDFEMASRIASMTFGPVFKQIAHTLVEAFQNRAKEIYG